MFNDNNRAGNSNRYVTLLKFLGAPLIFVIVSILQSCSNPGELQAVAVSVPFKLQASPQIGTNLWAVLTVDGIDYSESSETSDGKYQFNINLPSGIEYTFSVKVLASRPEQFAGSVTVASISTKKFFVSQDNPDVNNITLGSYEYNYNDDGDLYNNWEEVKQGYNPKLKETKLNPLFVHDGAAGVLGSNDIAKGIATTADGGWVAVGYSNNASGNDDMAMWKFSADGSLDPSVGNGGVFSHDNAAGGHTYDNANSIAVTADGSWVVTGESFNGLNYDAVVW